MSKVIYLILVLCYSVKGVSQENKNEELAIKNSIETFFEGFHSQDSLKMKSRVYGNIKLFSIQKTDDIYNIDESNFSNFLKSIVSIPENISFKEELFNYNIKFNHGMAHVWVNYTFYVNNNISHCGINSFQLYKDIDSIWKIIYLGDTRKKECK